LREDERWMPRAPHAATRVREKRETARAREIPRKEVKREREQADTGATG